MRRPLRHPAYLSQETTQARRRVLRLIAVMLLGVLAYGFVTIGPGSRRVGRAIAPGDGAAIFQAAEIMRATNWVFFWIFAIIILFLVFFGYRLFVRWQSLSSELIRKLEQANTDLAVMARTDALSGLNNRRISEQYMTEQWKRALRGEPSGLLMIDIDHFNPSTTSTGTIPAMLSYGPWPDNCVRSCMASTSAATGVVKSLSWSCPIPTWRACARSPSACGNRWDAPRFLTASSK